MGNPEWDVWTAPDDAVQELYPATQKLVARLRRRRWYYRAIAYLPVFGWGALMVYALYVDGLQSDPFAWQDLIGMVIVAAFMGYTAWCLLAPGLWRRMIGYFLSAVVALLGGLGSCLMGSLLALGAQSAGGPPGLVAGLYLLAGVMGAFLSLMAMIHILLLIVVSARLYALTSMRTLRALKSVRGDVATEIQVAWARVRTPFASAGPLDTTPPAAPSGDPASPTAKHAVPIDPTAVPAATPAETLLPETTAPEDSPATPTVDQTRPAEKRDSEVPPPPAAGLPPA